MEPRRKTTSITRAEIIRRMVSGVPLCYTGDIKGIRAWTRNLNDGANIELISPTGREISFYLGPARRFYGEPKATMFEGRGRVALVIKREFMDRTQSWDFTPFDVGEVLYHWRHDRIIGPTWSEKILDGLLTITRPCHKEVEGLVLPQEALTECFSSFLGAGFQDPRDYLKSWAPPRPATCFGIPRNALYRAATDRWFGRLRAFAPCWTYEVRNHPGEETSKLEIPLEFIERIFIIDDAQSREKNALADFLYALNRRRFRRVETIMRPPGVLHPDLIPLLLEGATSRHIFTSLSLYSAKELRDFV